MGVKGEFCWDLIKVKSGIFFYPLICPTNTVLNLITV